LRRIEVAVTADARQILATTGTLRNWTPAQSGATSRSSLPPGSTGGAAAPDQPAGQLADIDRPGRADDDAEQADAATSFHHGITRLEHGVIGLPASTWAGGVTEVDIDVAAPPEPALFIVQVVGISSFLGAYGLGRTVKTFTLLPGETTTISTRTWRASAESVAQGSSIIDSYDESSAERFAQTVMSETTDAATQEKTENWYAEAEVKGSIGIASANVSGGGGGEYSSSTEEFSKAVDEATGEHAAEASSHRENTVTSSSERSVSTEDEEVVERTIKNINVKRTLNFAIRELNQAYTTKIHLKDVRIAFSNGRYGTWREESISGLRRLVAEVVKPEHVDDVCRDILGTIAVVQDVDGAPVNVLEQVRLDRCGTKPRFRDAEPADDCSYPAPTPDGRLYYRFKRGPLGQPPDEEHPVEGVVMKRREIVMATDSVVAEALLGTEDALDQYSADLQLETIREKRLASDREKLAQRIVATQDATAAELFATVFGPTAGTEGTA
jgi:hypothetical protein